MGESAQRLSVHQDAKLLVLTNDLHLTGGEEEEEEERRKSHAEAHILYRPESLTKKTQICLQGMESVGDYGT